FTQNRSPSYRLGFACRKRGGVACRRSGSGTTTTTTTSRRRRRHFRRPLLHRPRATPRLRRRPAATCGSGTHRPRAIP
uniref:Uncharacterized protein n=1 Tax=Aegilops tauschii subsp. strangulata TaxID=200361 RepID=A0A453L8Q0_AEGTS